MKNLAKKLFVLYFGIILLLVAFPTYLQPPLIYLNWINFPKLDKNHETFGFEQDSVIDLVIPSTNNVQLGAWLISPKLHLNCSNKKPERVLIYAHGNAGNRALFNRIHLYKSLRQFLDCSTHILAFDYRGFGDSSWVMPNEKGLQQDVVSVVKFTQERFNIESQQIFLLGESLGTGVVSYAASKMSRDGKAPGGLVLIAPYTSIREASLKYSTIPLLRPFSLYKPLADLIQSAIVEVWPTESIIANVDCRILLVHGLQDMDMPYEFSRRLFQIASGNQSFSEELLGSNSLKKSLDSRIWHLELKYAAHRDLYHFETTFNVLKSWLSR